MNYIAKFIDKIGNGKGCWNYIKVGVFKIDEDKEEQVGEYIRDYSSLYDTFFYFRMNGKDLALYSKDYTATRVMSLPDCKDLGGEEVSAGGFCPVEYFVPAYVWEQDIKINNGKTVTCCLYNTEANESGEIIFDPSKATYHELGFVSGCVWGDDSGGWKISCLDLKEADKGIIQRKNLLGYHQLPECLSLKKSLKIIDFNEYNPKKIRFTMAHVKSFEIEDFSVTIDFDKEEGI